MSVSEMAAKVKPSSMEVSESSDNPLPLMVAVSVGATVGGSSDISYYVYPFPVTHPQGPFLCGEDYPALVHVWGNKDDDIFDNL